MNHFICECNAPATVIDSVWEGTRWVTVAYCWADYLKKSTAKSEVK